MSTTAVLVFAQEQSPFSVSSIAIDVGRSLTRSQTFEAIGYNSIRRMSRGPSNAAAAGKASRQNTVGIRSTWLSVVNRLRRKRNTNVLNATVVSPLPTRETSIKRRAKDSNASTASNSSHHMMIFIFICIGASALSVPLMNCHLQSRTTLPTKYIFHIALDPTPIHQLQISKPVELSAGKDVLRHCNIKGTKKSRMLCLRAQCSQLLRHVLISFRKIL